MRNTSKVLLIGLFLSATLAFTGTVYANHFWADYHWARTANPLNLKLGDNVSSIWDSHLALASADWSLSSVLDTSIVLGRANPRNCRPTNGRVEVCNSRYGNNGWLGVAQIWVSGSHITQGTVRLNDTYFNTSPYNSAIWRQFVTCQEIGHTFGLDHQDEDFNNANLNTCMDYARDPSTNTHPNAHDYEALEIIYAHLDSIVTAFSKTQTSGSTLDASEASEWGTTVRKSKDGRSSLHERDLGRGQKIFTFVIWAD